MVVAALPARAFSTTTRVGDIVVEDLKIDEAIVGGGAGAVTVVVGAAVLGSDVVGAPVGDLVEGNFVVGFGVVGGGNTTNP